MTTYDVALEGQHDWEIDSPSTTVFDFDYKGGRDQLLRLYDKGTRRQWIGSDRLDWSLDVDPEGPVGMPDELHPLFGTPWWDKMNDKEHIEARRHLEAWRFSQFMHGEQGALICTAKIVQTVPDVDSKFYAATQVIDEARHVEVYSRYLHDKVQRVYPLNRHLEALLQDVIADRRWDMTYLGMQVIVEGLALAAFGLIRNLATEPLGKAINAYVMQDEARHVTFGRLALRDYYPQLTAAERDEREQFCVDACYLMRDRQEFAYEAAVRMRDRFMSQEGWERMGVNPRDVLPIVMRDPTRDLFQQMLFSKIVPNCKKLGLLDRNGSWLRRRFEEMGVIQFEDWEDTGEEYIKFELDRTA